MYPVALDLTGKTCVVVGGGVVATRKINDLLEAGAKTIVVISPSVTPTLADHASSGQIILLNTPYQTGALKPLTSLSL